MRKVKKDSELLSEVLKLRLTSKELSLLRELARAEDRSVSAMLRWILLLEAKRRKLAA
jgi:hypothetical protein